MVDERTLKTELARLLLADCHHRAAPHREGQVRGVFFALTGHDIGPRCGFYDSVLMMCVELGWGCKPCGEDGWEIDWHDECDEDALRAAGVEIDDR